MKCTSIAKEQATIALVKTALSECDNVPGAALYWLAYEAVNWRENAEAEAARYDELRAGTDPTRAQGASGAGVSEEVPVNAGSPHKPPGSSLSRNGGGGSGGQGESE